MSLRIFRPGDRRYFKGLIHAPPGHGKTHFLGSAQEDDRTFPMLFLDFESGWESLAGLDIDVAEVRSWRDADEAIELLQSDSEENDYRSVGFDSISEWHRWALLHSLDKHKSHRKNPDKFEWDDYNEVSVLLRRRLRRIRDLNMHVFFAAHSQDKEIPRMGRIVVPDLAGKMSDEVAGMVSTVGYLALFENDEGEEDRVLLLRNNPKYRVKARTPWKESIPEEIEDPDVTTLLDTLGYEK